MDPALETQKHQGSKKAASQPRGTPGFGKMSAHKQPFLCGPTPRSTVLGLDRQKNACFSVLHLVFPKLIFYHNHNKNHHQKSTILVIIFTHKGFSGGSAVKNLPATQEPQEMWVQSLDWKDPLEKEMATHSSIHAWRIPWTEDPGGLQSTGLQRVRHDWSDLAHAHSNHINQSNHFLGLSFIRAGPRAGCWDGLLPDLGAAHSSLPSTFILVIMVLAVHWLYWQNDNDVKKFWRCLLWDSEKAVAHHSSSLAWKIPWTEEPGRLQFMGSRRVGHNWMTSLSLFTFMHWRRKWQPTPVFLPGESQGWQSLVGCHPWGCTESDTTEET